LFDMTV